MDPITTLVLKGSQMNIYEQRLRAYLQRIASGKICLFNHFKLHTSQRLVEDSAGLDLSFPPLLKESKAICVTKTGVDLTGGNANTLARIIIA